ncbi:very-long-chain enoyl-CoA reductase-like [Pyrus x bretschneideri]|uniref:very-long-chain enoyl-CoA reductase-like n=1 Tax=Pyrus x bretschneideri TaxID=225117 RepID=UPI00202F0C71|nr:very-long-chain enoyl-CoA reductase-like [Pyrus x bretschneideri]
MMVTSSMSIISTLIFPPPPSIFMTAMSVISFTSLANAGISEIRGKHMQYSKFWNFNNPEKTAPNSEKQQRQVVTLSGRTGMLVAYTPAFVTALTSLLFFPHNDIRSLLLSYALTLHFLKRILEVQFVHKYSGGMGVDTAVPICLSYLLSTGSMIYGQYLSSQGLGFPEPAIDMKSAGIVLFVIGISGNLYHHYLLSEMRAKPGEEKEYKIPKGGLFELVICPHYLFEITTFLGISFISQTLYSFSFTAGTALYLAGRSYATRNWYRSKFKYHFPNNLKALVPYVF